MTQPCGTCRPGVTRKVVINAFHTLSDARAEAPRCNNAMLVPVDYAGMVTMVERYRAQGPIHELEIAAHGTPTLPTNLHVSDPAHPRWSMPGSAIIGQRGELVSGMSIETNASHAASSQRLGRCVEPGGIITWQCCNLGIAQPPYGDFLSAFSALAPHLRAVLAGQAPTLVGTPGIQGPAGSTLTYRSATAGVSGPSVPGPFLSENPDTAFAPQRPLGPIVEELGRAGPSRP